MKIFIYCIFLVFFTCSSTIANTWNGNISNDWNTPGNWSDGTVPDENTDVTIPYAANYPLISLGSGAECRDMGTGPSSYLVIGDTLTVHGDLNVNGQISIPNTDSVYVYGDVDWRAGSSAYIGSWSHFYVYGDWQFYEGSDVRMTNGVVSFVGDSSSVIISHEEDSHFYNLSIGKTEGAQVAVAEWSTESLHVQHDLTILDGAIFYSNASVSILVNGDFRNNIGGQFQFDNGTFVMTGGGLPDIYGNDGHFNNLKFQSDGTTYVRTDINVDGNLTIDSGSALNARYSDIEIRGDWINNSSHGTFVGEYGTVIFRGSDSTIESAGTEYFYNLSVNGFVSPPTSAEVSIEQNQNINVENDVNINYLGKLTVPEGAKLRAGNEINVNFVGTLSAMGVSGNQAYIGGYGENYPRPSINIKSNGNIAAEYVVFEYLDENGVNINSSGKISTQYPLSHCMFRYGVAGGTLLTVDNDQVLNIFFVEFPENTWNGSHNIRKNNDQGQIWFLNYSGLFAGPRYESDPYRRVLWHSGPHDVFCPLPGIYLLLLHE